MKHALFIIANNYRGNRAVRELNVGRDLVGLGGFFEHVAGYDIVEIVQDVARETVLAELEKLLARLDPGDLLMIYFGGHGIQGAEHLLVLPPGISDPADAPLGFLAVAELRRRTDGRDLLRAIILDCCRNDDASAAPVTSAASDYSRRVQAMGAVARDVGVAPSASPRTGGRGSFAIFCACSDDDIAPELGKTGKGLFSTALQNVLKAAHRAGQRVRIDDDLRDKVEAEMHRLAREHNLTHTPQPWKAGNGTPEVLASTVQPQTPAIASSPAKAPLPAIAPSPVEKIIRNSVGMELVRIEPGSFLMGSPPAEEGRAIDETQHTVMLTRPYYIAATPVTQKQWKAVIGQGDDPSHFKGDDLPVEQVSWNDAFEFCEKLSQIERKKYRLPTEAEWEYACRAGTTTPFNTGATIGADQANYNASKAYGRGKIGEYRKETVPVRSFKPNAWGLYEMHGNVWEWCSDWYDDYPKGTATDPSGPNEGPSRVLRGGSCFFNPVDCRSASRYNLSPVYRHYLIGFRVVLDSR